MSGSDNGQVALQKFGPTDLQAFLNHFGRKLVDTVAVSVCQDVIDDTTFIGW